MITYTLAVKNDHVVHGFPYISETGNSPPESCIFAQLLNIVALLLGCAIYIRHRQVEQWLNEHGEDLVDRWAIPLALWSGLVSCFGLDILANFQSQHVFVAHMAGAMVCFSSGTLYFCLQTYLSQKMATDLNELALFWVRSTLATLSVVLTIMLIIPGMISMVLLKEKPYKDWKPTDEGWGWHVTSAIAEWILAIVYCVFLLTFAPEFRTIKLKAPEVKVIYRANKRLDLSRSETQETTVEEV